MMSVESGDGRRFGRAFFPFGVPTVVVTEKAVTRLGTAALYAVGALGPVVRARCAWAAR